MVKIKCSVGELLDKLSILEVKTKKVTNPEKLQYINAEFNELETSSVEFKNIESINKLYYDLVEINSKLWDIEDKLRECEREKKFDDEFVELARSVYYTNDHRFEIKNKINSLTNSELREQKDYKPY